MAITYDKTIWVNKETAVSSTNMNHIEDGLEAVTNFANSLEESIQNCVQIQGEQSIIGQKIFEQPLKVNNSDVLFGLHPAGEIVSIISEGTGDMGFDLKNIDTIYFSNGEGQQVHFASLTSGDSNEISLFNISYINNKLRLPDTKEWEEEQTIATREECARVFYSESELDDLHFPKSWNLKAGDVIYIKPGETGNSYIVTNIDNNNNTLILKGFTQDGMYEFHLWYNENDDEWQSDNLVFKEFGSKLYKHEITLVGFDDTAKPYQIDIEVINNQIGRYIGWKQPSDIAQYMNEGISMKVDNGIRMAPATSAMETGYQNKELYISYIQSDVNQTDVQHVELYMSQDQQYIVAQDVVTPL